MHVVGRPLRCTRATMPARQPRRGRLRSLLASRGRSIPTAPCRRKNGHVGHWPHVGPTSARLPVTGTRYVRRDAIRTAFHKRLQADTCTCSPRARGLYLRPLSWVSTTGRLSPSRQPCSRAALPVLTDGEVAIFLRRSVIAGRCVRPGDTWRILSTPSLACRATAQRRDGPHSQGRRSRSPRPNQWAFPVQTFRLQFGMEPSMRSGRCSGDWRRSQRCDDHRS
jgi:hypothetical protein